MSMGRLHTFIAGMAHAADAAGSDAALMAAARPLLEELVASDDWLPQDCAVPHPQLYRQYRLHCDPRERFCLVSFVWGPGQSTPIHDHTVWGLIGMLRGAEIATSYERTADGRLVRSGEALRLEPGDIGAVSPEIGDIHQVANAFDDRVSISIHIYGGDIGKVKRHVYDMAGGVKDFVSGYSNAPLAEAQA